MAADVGGLVADIGLNVAGLRGDIKQANRELKRGTNRMNRHLGSLRKNVNNVGRSFKGLAGVLTVGLLSRGVKSIADAGLAMDRFNRAFRAATGSFQGGAREMEFVSSEAQRLGLDLEAVAGSYAKLTAAARGTEIAGQGARDIFTAVSEASVVLGLTADQTQGALTAIEQIISKGKVSAEELRGQLGERLPGALQVMARALGVTTGELDDLLKKGEIGIDSLPKFAAELRATYGDELPTAINSSQAAIARFNTAIFELKSAIAESGVLDALASVATGIANIINPSLGIAFEETQNDIISLRQTIERELAGTGGVVTPSIQAFKGELDSALDKLEELARKQARLLAGPADAPSGIGNGLGPPEDLEKLRARFAKTFETVTQEVARRLEEFSLVEHLFPPEEAARIRDRIQSVLVDEIELNVRPMSDAIKDLFEPQDATNLAERFGRSMGLSLQSEFSNAFMGIETSFGELLKRMAADFAASSLLKGLASLIPGPFGKFLAAGIPGFATGGSFKVGGNGGTDSQLVAFKASPDETVSVTRPGQSIGGAVSAPSVIHQEFNFPFAFPEQLEAFVRNVAGPAGRNAAMQVLNAQRGRF